MEVDVRRALRGAGALRRRPTCNHRPRALALTGYGGDNRTVAVVPYRFDPRDTAEALFGAELRARREMARLSLRRLAPMVLASHDLLARIEKAQRRPQPDLVDRLDNVLEANGVLRRLAAPFTDGVLVPRVVVLDPDAAVPVLRALIARVRAADHTMATAHLDDLAAHARAAQQLASRLDSARQRALGRLIAEAHQLSGWMLFDRGSVALAEKAFAASRLAAEQAGALDLLAFIGGPNAAFVSTWSGEPDRGAERAYGALSWARRSGNRRLSAFVLTMSARAHARLGESELCTQMLTEAESELSRHRPDQPDPPWLEVFDAAALAGHRGSCLLDLGHHGHAIDALQEQASAGSAERFVRNRTIWFLEQADAQLRLGQHEAAALTVDDAITRLGSGAVSPRVRRMFCAIELVLCACGDPAVTPVADRLLEFNAVNA
ncbi:helix-turn-helix transcriptional regulator [Nocardia aurea]|uniref:helix-turn-helix transcriptional regulator n=1 Tax=Nocardia aurea TaxID=2144174 RepID=UPI002FCD980D